MVKNPARNFGAMNKWQFYLLAGGEHKFHLRALKQSLKV